MISDALERLCPQRSKGHLTSLRLKEVSGKGSLVGVGWGGRWFVEVMEEEGKLKGGKEIYEGGRKEFLEVTWCWKRAQPLE